MNEPIGQWIVRLTDDRARHTNAPIAIVVPIPYWWIRNARGTRGASN